MHAARTTSSGEGVGSRMMGESDSGYSADVIDVEYERTVSRMRRRPWPKPLGEWICPTCVWIRVEGVIIFFVSRHASPRKLSVLPKVSMSISHLCHYKSRNKKNILIFCSQWSLKYLNRNGTKFSCGPSMLLHYDKHFTYIISFNV